MLTNRLDIILLQTWNALLQFVFICLLAKHSTGRDGTAMIIIMGCSRL